ncbi:unnamed protein product [Rotaria sordida]|uniref:G-protein coupled receptors family 1 profile domain-containing protein n=1 Tax=Rotaria sordida TaxID=392033 RepID=A0A814U5L1_9BILA|nr:unnamed protein product [Rotaria sordida]CAF1171206.1 unnamed protein product [Rotaria sordida]CAF1234889.1 unnamed protein product [Rotaria sordida]CAF4136639.1 unnamed protein product [Rotaria sordida]
MNISNQTNICQNIDLIFDTSSKCFNDISPPNITDCDLMIVIYRLILIDCYIERLFFPTAATLIVIGTILNLFSLFCFLKINKRNSQNVYLSVLALGDTLNLHVNFTIPILRQIDIIDDYFHNSSILCRINGFLTEFFLIFPTWIVVLLTFERLICVLRPLKCHSLYTHKRAKISIFILILIVICLCIYRFFDLKGIDQGSVFSIVACDGYTYKTLIIIRHLNLIIWAILPECLTLIMNLIIIYNIKLATQNFEPFYSQARQAKFNQATKTVLLISILFLIFHTPTGIMIGLNLIYATKERTIGLTIILVSRKLTVILYEISLCCKFFIYNQTFRNFKDIFYTSVSRFTRHTNSAKLGRPRSPRNHARYHLTKSFQSGQIKSNTIYRAKETDLLVHQQRKDSFITITSISRASRDQQQQQRQPFTFKMMNNNDSFKITLPQTPILLRRYTADTRMAISNNNS